MGMDLTGLLDEVEGDQTCPPSRSILKIRADYKEAYSLLSQDEHEGALDIIKAIETRRAAAEEAQLILESNIHNWREKCEWGERVLIKDSFGDQPPLKGKKRAQNLVELELALEAGEALPKSWEVYPEGIRTLTEIDERLKGCLETLAREENWFDNLLEALRVKLDPERCQNPGC